MTSIRYAIGYTTGTFDQMHQNHFELLRSMKQRCRMLIVGLTSDSLCVKQKRKPLMNFEQRKCILEHCKYVDTVVEHNGDTKQVAHSKLKFHILFIGEDYFDRQEYALFESTHPHIPVIYLPRMSHVNTSTLVRTIESDILDKIYIKNWGISGPLLTYQSPDQHIIIKPVAIGSTEHKYSNGFNAYQLPFPPPRNWRRIYHTPPQKYVNISGINAWREITIHDLLRRPWNPVYKLKQTFLYPDPQEPETIKSDWTHLSLERSRPKAVYWLYQTYAGITLSQWLRSTTMDVSQLKYICIKIHEYIQDMLQTGIIHGDIHTDNVCIIEKENQDPTVHIIDFGWCMHDSFHMGPDERTYYKTCIEHNFDWSHFVYALEWSGQGTTWWKELSEFPLIQHTITKPYVPEQDEKSQS